MNDLRKNMTTPELREHLAALKAVYAENARQIIEFTSHDIPCGCIRKDQAQIACDMVRVTANASGCKL
jgi:hypothetical protein